MCNSGNRINDIDIQKIQERYYQAENKLDTNSGHGIGLSIVQLFLKLFGSKLIIDNSNQTNFNFYLPCEFRPISATYALPAQHSSASYKLRILILEDDKQIIELYKHIFKDTACVVSYVKGLKELESAKGPFDILLLDYHIDGKDLESQNHTIAGKIHDKSLVNIVSGRQLNKNEVSLDVEIDQIILKPFDTDGFVQKLIDSFRDKRYGRPDFSAIISDYDGDKRKYLRAIQILKNEWTTIRPQLVHSISNTDIQAFIDIKHKIITSIRRLNLHHFEAYLENIDLEKGTSTEEISEFVNDALHYYNQVIAAFMDENG